MTKSSRKPTDLKYDLYEEAVQSPDIHVGLLAQFYRELRGKEAERLREDFCGTFAISCEWIKLSEKNSAVGLDLDPEPLSYGRRKHLVRLTASQKKRLDIQRANVLSVSKKPVDLIAACNFSFFIFKQKQLLMKYLQVCQKSLQKDGILVLEMAGGPGMIEKSKDRKSMKLGKRKFTYVWDQKSFDPITHDAHYAIHFKFANGGGLTDAFTYDWRLWSIPEIRDALIEAGFKETRVYWETEHKGEPTGEYALAEEGDNAHAWVAQVIGLKG